MEKIQANMYFDVVFLYENRRTCLSACNFFTSASHYIIMERSKFNTFIDHHIRMLTIFQSRSRSPWNPDDCSVLFFLAFFLLGTL